MAKLYSNTFKPLALIGPEALPLLDFNVARVGNYSRFSEQIKAKTRELDELLARTGGQVPDVIFDLMDYMDGEVARRQHR